MPSVIPECKEGKIALLYVGAFVPNRAEYRNEASSTAGNLFQLNFLDALLDSELPKPTAHSYIPVPSYPRHRLFFRGKKERLESGLEFRSLSHINLGAIKILTLGLVAAWRTLLWGLENRRADWRVVIAYNLNAPPAWPISFVCRILDMDFVPFVGDIYVPGEVVKDTLLRRIEFESQKRMLPAADGLLVANRAIVEDFAPERHSLLLEGGVRDEWIDRFEKSSRVEDGKFRIVFAGQLSVLNGVTLLLDALKLCDNPDWIVTILGGGQFADEVRRTSENDHRIEFKGLCDHETVLQTYEQADLLLNLRRTDYQTHRYVFPSKVVECLSTGRPLLSTLTGHVESDFGDFVYLLSEESPEALAKTLEDISRLPREEREATGALARAYARKHKTWRAQTLKLIEYLNEHVFTEEREAA